MTLRKRKRMIYLLAMLLLLLLLSYLAEQNGWDIGNSPSSDSEVVQLIFPSDEYPETAKHIEKAISKGEPKICTIDREGAEENRRESLKGIPTKNITTAMNGLWPCVEKAERERTSHTYRRPITAEQAAG